MVRTSDLRLEENNLWDDYLKKRTLESRNRLVGAYRPFVEGIVHKYFPHSNNPEDLVSVAIIALINLLDSYSPSSKDNKKSYIFFRVLGSIKDHFREEDFVPRDTRIKQRMLESALERHHSTHQFPPTNEELSDLLCTDLDAEEITRAVSRIPSIFHYGVKDSDGKNEFGDYVDPLAVDPFKELEKRDFLNYLSSGLKGTERVIFQRHYIEGKRFAEIAEELSISPARVSQINNKIIPKMKKLLSRSEKS